MKKLLLIAAISFTLTSKACIGSLEKDTFHAEGIFLSHGDTWRIASVNGQIHYEIYRRSDGKLVSDTIVAFEQALDLVKQLYADGHGEGGDC